MRIADSVHKDLYVDHFVVATYPEMRSRHKQQNGNRSCALILEEFLENVRPGARPASVIAGPRTQGGIDSAWVTDTEVFKRGPDVADTVADKHLSVSDFMMAVATVGDPTIQFKSDCDELVHRWFVADLKHEYQKVRVPGKRPWPEFAASMRAGFGFVESDASALSLAAGVDMATLERGRLVVAPLLLGKPFDTPVLYARTCTTMPLGHVCKEAVRTAQSSQGTTALTLADSARALAMQHEKVAKKMLASLVASRSAALTHFSSAVDSEACAQSDAAGKGVAALCI